MYVSIFLYITWYGLIPESEKTRGQVSRSGDEQPAQHEICCGTGFENSFEMQLVSKATEMCLEHLELKTSTYLELG